MPQTKSIVRAALAYAQRLEWPVFPCKPRDKHPLTEHGFKNATRDESQIKEWWKQWPNANIGVPTGLKFWVLDIDPRNGGDDALEKLVLRHDPLPDTIQQMTGGGGRHYLFRPPFGAPMKSGELAEGIDIKAHGGYILVAPSIHPSGNPYVWDGTTPITKQEIMPAPPWLLLEIESARHKTGATGPTVAPERIKKGQQHRTLFRLGAAMRAKGFGETEIFAALWECNKTRCEAPGPEENIRKLAASICAQYEAGSSIPKSQSGKNGAPRDEDAPPDEAPQLILPIGLTVRELLNLKLDPPEMLIEDVLPRRGAVLLTASQKTGKTILAAQMAITVATNTPLFQNYHLCAHGPVLILEQDDPAGDASFQDIYRRSKVPDNAPLRFYGKIGLRLSQAFYEWLEREIVAHKAVMVVLDSYTALRPHRAGGGDIVQMEQQEFTALDSLGKKLNALILVIHHESTSTKANAQLDWDSRGAGTYGITMATEGQLSLVRFRDLSIGASERLLRIKGRHQKTIEMVLAFQEDVCNYRHIFDGDACSYYPLLHDIYRFKGSQSFSPADLKVEIGTSDATVYRYLAALRYTGKLIREERGNYRLSQQAARELGGEKEDQ